MIRAFTIFCKLNFIKLSAKQLFFQAMHNLSYTDMPCPHCGAKHPVWSHHASYERYVISIEQGIPVCYMITVTRLICSSCKHTHAILPEILIPYGSYSLIFILNVLRDYYLKTYTVLELCNKYQISVSTLYAWKRLFLMHKKLWLGFLEDSILSPREFLAHIPSVDSSHSLHTFFRSHGHSFLQGVSKTAHSGYS